MRSPKTFAEMSSELTEEVGARAPGGVSAQRADYDAVGSRLDALAPDRDKGKAVAAAEVRAATRLRGSSRRVRITGTR
jgi:hypothetical protein